MMCGGTLWRDALLMDAQLKGHLHGAYASHIPALLRKQAQARHQCMQPIWLLHALRRS
jgi:hypothetical protein